MSKLKYKGGGFFTILLNHKPIVFISNFIFQGMRYMTIGERTFKLFITLSFATLLSLLLNNFLLSLFLGHTLNYILNGQFFVMLRYMTSKKGISKSNLLRYLELIEKVSDQFKPKDVLFIGSFSRGKMSGSSDLDVRIYHNRDIISSLKAYLMAFWLRFLGLIYLFPVDVYCFSDMTFMNKINSSEIPVNLMGDKLVLLKYPDSISIIDRLESLEFTF